MSKGVNNDPEVRILVPHIRGKLLFYRNHSELLLRYTLLDRKAASLKLISIPYLPTL